MQEHFAITPSADVRATVRHGHLPESAPDELVPYVVPVRDDQGTLVDWPLTDDVLAFGDVDVPTIYRRWRGTWERTWVLDPESSLVRLVVAAGAIATVDDRRMVRIVCDGVLCPDAEIDAEMTTQFADDLEMLRDALRDQDRTGFGFVDATPGRDRTGLMRAWSPRGGAEVLADDGRVRVTMQPDDGLCIEGDVPGGGVRGIDEVAFDEGSARVRSGDDVIEIAAPDALGWVAPGSTGWRVRVVPEVIVWARTFGGLVEACRAAAALRRPVTLRGGFG